MGNRISTPSWPRLSCRKADMVKIKWYAYAITRTRAVKVQTHIGFCPRENNILFLHSAAYIIYMCFSIWMFKFISFINIIFSHNDIIESSTFQIVYSREPITAAAASLPFSYNQGWWGKQNELYKESLTLSTWGWGGTGGTPPNSICQFPPNSLNKHISSWSDF